MAARVVLYTTRICPYCHAAKRLLEKKGSSYEEIRVDDRADLRNWLVEVSGQRTVPQIFINGQSVGGYSDLSALDRAGQLDAMLAQAPAVDNPALRS
jgi:glutaredoxin 3